MLTRAESDMVRAVRAACAGVASRMEVSISQQYDRLNDFARGELAAAREIARRIGELDLEAVLGGKR
jgi:hypothetical protein